MPRPLVQITLLFVFETADAIKVRLDEDTPPVWLPKSQIDFEMQGSTNEAKSTVSVTLPEFLAIQKELV